MEFPEKYRKEGFAGQGGMFIIPLREKNMIKNIVCIASDGQGWDHVSISIKSYSLKELHRCPNWEEMKYVKELFWSDNDCVVQFHPPAEEYVNNHKYCLHLWKSQSYIHETPMKSLV